MTTVDEPAAFDRFGRRVVVEPPAPEPAPSEATGREPDDGADEDPDAEPGATARTPVKPAPPKEYPQPVSFYSEEGQRRWAEYQKRPVPPDTPDDDPEPGDGSWQPDDERPGGRRSAARRLSPRGSIDGSIDD